MSWQRAPFTSLHVVGMGISASSRVLGVKGYRVIGCWALFFFVFSFGFEVVLPFFEGL